MGVVHDHGSGIASRLREVQSPALEKQVLGGTEEAAEERQAAGGLGGGGVVKRVSRHSVPRRASNGS